jgi:hypothetical protein
MPGVSGKSIRRNRRQSDPLRFEIGACDAPVLAQLKDQKYYLVNDIKPNGL